MSRQGIKTGSNGNFLDLDFDLELLGTAALKKGSADERGVLYYGGPVVVVGIPAKPPARSFKGLGIFFKTLAFELLRFNS